jgi:hypothetical protein
MKKIKLISFKYLKGQKKWESEKVVFARDFTILHAENGAGKSPMVNGMMFALGHTRKIQNLICNNTESVSLEFQIDENIYILKRDLSDKFHMEIFKDGEKIRDFVGKTNKITLACNEFLFEIFGLRTVALSTSAKKIQDRKPSKLYIQQIIPMFFISQLNGWNHYYESLDTWILDQQEEVLRLMLDIPPAHPFSTDEVRKDLFDKRDRLDSEISQLKNKISFYSKKLGKNSMLSLNDLYSEKEKYENKVIGYKEAISGTKSEKKLISDEMESLSDELSRVKRKIYQGNLKLNNLTQLATEIIQKTEVHEDAYDSESAFEKFCGNESCELFKKKKVPFAKKILYLKDQYKDIETSIIDEKKSIESLSQMSKKLQKEIDELKEGQIDSEDKNLFANLDIAIDKLVYYKEMHANKEAYDTYSANLADANNDYNSCQDSIDTFSSSQNKLDEASVAKRNDFLTYFKKWVKTLKTPNVEVGSITINSKFQLSINEDVFTKRSEQEGSTRNRIILAYHTALLEVSLKYNTSHPRFLIVDTPGKDETNRDHLKEYFNQLRNLNKEYGDVFQVIVAYKESVINPISSDKVVVPSFDFDGELRYLGEKD